MKLVLQRPDGLYWQDYSKIAVRDNPCNRWGPIETALIVENGEANIGEEYHAADHTGTWFILREYPEPIPMTPDFTLEEIEAAQNMIKGE